MKCLDLVMLMRRRAMKLDFPLIELSHLFVGGDNIPTILE